MNPGSSFIYNYQTVGDPEHYQAQFEISETVFAGRDCVKMEVVGDYPFLCTPLDSPIYFYESNDSVFFAMEVDDSFRLAYNFNAEVGSGWEYALPVSESVIDYFNVEVMAVNTSMVDGNEVKEIVLKYHSMSAEPHVEIFPEEIIVRELIGSVNGFFIPLGNVLGCDGETSINLQCFNSPTVNYINPEFGSCTVSAETVYAPEPLRIYPNPASDHININLPTDTESKVRILQLDSKLVFNQTGFIGSERIRLPEFSAGMYIVEVLNNENRYFGKILVK